MAQPRMQHAFHAGEWAPALNARVDLAKYHSAAALLRNFFVDYRGGASTRTGTKYVIQAFKSNTAVRLITFQASFTVGYELEFGDRYIRFIYNGAPVLEGAGTITGATKANPAVITQVGHGYATGDWVYITGVGGMTQLNGKYFIVTVLTANTYSLSDLRGNAIDSTAYGVYTTGGNAARIYTIVSPYAAADLALLKVANNINTMIICHPSYDPYVLTLIAATNWTLLPIIIGSSINAPTGVAVSTTLAAGNVNYSYLVTAVDANGQESGPSTPAALAAKTDLRSVAGTNRVTWSAAPGAQSYNIYKAELSYTNAVAAGAQYGFIGNVTGLTLDDSNIAPDFSITPPIPQNPFQGAGVASVAVTSAGAYTTVPGVTAAAAPSGGSTATLQAYLGVTATGAITNTNPGFAVGDLIVPDGSNSYGGLTLRITAVVGTTPSAVEIVSPGAISSGNTPANPVGFARPSGGDACDVALTWGVITVGVINAGAGYLTAPAVTFSAGAAAATATLAAASGGHPGLPGYFQQRLNLVGLSAAPQQWFMSQPGAPYNFNISNPVQPDNAISGQLVSGQLNTIKALVPMPSGLIMLSDKAAWLVNGGSNNEAITPINAVAHAHSYNGANDVPPIVANFDILYVQSKGSIVRDLTYNFYANIFTGTDISVLSSHLFYGYEILEWAWAEEPFKVVWAVRDDGVMLTLTFMKEQELIGWSHSDTNGAFKSVAVVTEGSVDAPYCVARRTIGTGATGTGLLGQYWQNQTFSGAPSIAQAEQPNFSSVSGPAAPYATNFSARWTGYIVAPITGEVVFYVTTDDGARLWLDERQVIDKWFLQSPTTYAVAFKATAGQRIPIQLDFYQNQGAYAMKLEWSYAGQAKTLVPLSVMSYDGTPVQYIERFTERNYPGGVADAWQVDAGLQYVGAPATSFSGGEHLAGKTVTGLADGQVITPFVMAASGDFVLPTAASKVTVGLAFTPQLKTLAIDTGATAQEPTIQGKRKKIPAVTVRVADTLGLKIGTTFENLVIMDDLVEGNVGSATNELVTNLVTGDARQVLDPDWNVPGQYCIEQSFPLPATILGVIPELAIGDTAKATA